MNAYKTNNYTNLFLEYGYGKNEIEERIESIFDQMFLDQDEKIYFEDGESMGYVVDTGNNDVRTEGMSYGMMVCVQLNKKNIFDRLWTWVMTYMKITQGENQGYFAWSVAPNGVKNSNGPAPDGEEFFAMALFFAAGRWGNGEGIYNYSKQASDILYECVHKGYVQGHPGHSMWEQSNKLIKFIPESNFSDPSYHLPCFYDIFSLLVDVEEQEFWKEAAAASRQYLHKACHPITGLAAEYAEYDGTPHNLDNHHLFYSDAYRVAANIGLDYEWFGVDKWEQDCANRIQTFFGEMVEGQEDYVYEIDGTKVGQKVLHPIGQLATIAQVSLASNGSFKEYFVHKLWNTPLRKGDRRYYDNFLYIFAFLALSGNYRIYI